MINFDLPKNICPYCGSNNIIEMNISYSERGNNKINKSYTGQCNKCFNYFSGSYVIDLNSTSSKPKHIQYRIDYIKGHSLGECGYTVRRKHKFLPIWRRVQVRTKYSLYSFSNIFETIEGARRLINKLVREEIEYNSKKSGIVEYYPKEDRLGWI